MQMHSVTACQSIEYNKKPRIQTYLIIHGGRKCCVSEDNCSEAESISQEICFADKQNIFESDLRNIFLNCNERRPWNARKTLQTLTEVLERKL